MSAWTAERLEALPEGTLLMVTWGDGAEERFLWCEGKSLTWKGEDCARTSSYVLARDAAAIRVLSVPVDALLSDETVNIAQREAWVSDSEGWSVRHGIRAAIAHVTGEAS